MRPTQQLRTQIRLRKTGVRRLFTPLTIGFNSFDTGKPSTFGRHLQAMAEDRVITRNISDAAYVPLASGKTCMEMLPGEGIQGEAVKEYIKA
jgi:hypothetical protein